VRADLFLAAFQVSRDFLFSGTQVLAGSWPTLSGHSLLQAAGKGGATASTGGSSIAFWLFRLNNLNLESLKGKKM
jgi:hypothetical protein